MRIKPTTYLILLALFFTLEASASDIMVNGVTRPRTLEEEQWYSTYKQKKIEEDAIQKVKDMEEEKRQSALEKLIEDKMKEMP